MAAFTASRNLLQSLAEPRRKSVRAKTLDVAEQMREEHNTFHLRMEQLQHEVRTHTSTAAAHIGMSLMLVCVSQVREAETRLMKLLRSPLDSWDDQVRV